MGRSAGVPDPNRLKRDVLIIERLRAGAMPRDIAAEFNLSPDHAKKHCGMLRRENGIPTPATRRRRRTIAVEKDHRTALEEVTRHLGGDFVSAHVKAREGVSYLDDGQTLEVLRLHAALKFVLLDAAELVESVERRLRQIDLQALEQVAQRLRGPE